MLRKKMFRQRLPCQLSTEKSAVLLPAENCIYQLSPNRNNDSKRTPSKFQPVSCFAKLVAAKQLGNSYSTSNQISKNFMITARDLKNFTIPNQDVLWFRQMRFSAEMSMKISKKKMAPSP